MVEIHSIGFIVILFVRHIDRCNDYLEQTWRTFHLHFALRWMCKLFSHYTSSFRVSTQCTIYFVIPRRDAYRADGSLDGRSRGGGQIVIGSWRRSQHAGRQLRVSLDAGCLRRARGIGDAPHREGRQLGGSQRRRLHATHGGVARRSRRDGGAVAFSRRRHQRANGRNARNCTHASLLRRIFGGTCAPLSETMYEPCYGVGACSG